MKSFLTGLLVALAALSVHVFFFKLYFLHTKRLLIFMITTLNICFLHREGLQKESACQPSVGKRLGFDGNSRLSAEDQKHAT